MEDPDKQNANPTILNPSDLPSRRNNPVIETRSDGGTGLFDGLIPTYSYLNDPFEQTSVSSDDDSDDAEQIDEQEIFGENILILADVTASNIQQTLSRPFRTRSTPSP